jgi:hypothetical protein
MGRRVTGRSTGLTRPGPRTTGRSPLPVSGYNQRGVIASGVDGRSIVRSYASLSGLIGVQEAFPVGSVYSNVTALDPSIELGYGNWQLFAVGTGASLTLMEITVQ